MRRGFRRTRAAAAAIGVTGAVILFRRMSPENARRGQQSAPPEPAVLARLAAWVPGAPRTPAGRLCAYAWAAPLTATGCVLGLLGGSHGRPFDGVVVFPAIRGPVGAVLSRRGFSATTLGHAVLTIPAEPSASLLAHELVHTRQAERFGLLFGPVYVGLLGRYGYWQHPFERAARSAGQGEQG